MKSLTTTWVSCLAVLLAAALPEVARAAGAPLVLTPVNAAVACADMVKKDFTQVAEAPATVASATEVGANCVVKGVIGGQQNFEMWLPLTGWTQRFLMSGCGGFCGMLSDPHRASAIRPAVGCAPFEQNQMAIATSDLGHVGAGFSDASWAADNPRARIDFAYLGMHRMTLAAKAVINVYYGRAQQKSYYLGCSDGGREGLQEAQRYPEDYDGILVGASVIDVTMNNTFYHGWNVRSNWTNWTIGSDGEPTATPLLTAAKIPALNAAVIKACGDEGGLVQDPRACVSKQNAILAGLSCKGAETDACLTDGQSAAVKKLWNGAADANGAQLTPGDMPMGSELGWVGGMAPTATQKLTDMGEYGYAASFLKYLTILDGGSADVTPANMMFALDGERGYAAVTKLSPLFDPNNPDLSRFAARGGKLIVHHGWSDTGVPPYETLNYWSRVRQQMGTEQASRFLALYMMPGVFHCAPGTPNITHADLLTPLLDWVEKGEAPGRVQVDFVTSDTDATVKFSRPLYPYPSIVKYAGGDPKAASSWVRADLPEGVSDILDWVGLANYKTGNQMWCENGAVACSLK